MFLVDNQDPFIPDDAGFHHPSSEQEVAAFVKRARRERKQVRVWGSSHSVKAGIYTAGSSASHPSRHHYNLRLDRMTKVELHPPSSEADGESMLVTAQAGCRLGLGEGEGASPDEESLFFQLDARGWALPDTGGISHQTVAGFLATGSAGGSLHGSLSESLVEIRMIDGEGNLRILTPKHHADLFNAAGVSFGLLGIFTAVTFRCIRKFNVEGIERTSSAADCEIDLFGEGHVDPVTGRHKPSLQEFLMTTEFTRLLWWPQQGVEKVVVWKAGRTAAEPFIPRPYVEIGFRFPCVPALTHEVEELTQTVAGAYYTLLGRWTQSLKRMTHGGKRFQLAKALIRNQVLPRLIPLVTNAFVNDGSQVFRETWWKALPMDDRISQRHLPVEFTELWIPLSRATDVMVALRDHYARGGLAATGSMACEIYGAKACEFWMSPSYKEPMVRVDIFWTEGNTGSSRTDYYAQFWKLLQRFGFRFHWAKHLSGPETPTGIEYRRKHLPRWDDFLLLREELDPDDIFLTDYWQKNLGIQRRNADAVFSSDWSVVKQSAAAEA